MNKRNLSVDDYGQVQEGTLVMGRRSLLAVEMVNRWGMVAGMPDGEDSSGRARLRLATPEELVDRAVEVSNLLNLLFDRLEAEGMTGEDDLWTICKCKQQEDDHE